MNSSTKAPLLIISAVTVVLLVVALLYSRRSPQSTPAEVSTVNSVSEIKEVESNNSNASVSQLRDSAIDISSAMKSSAPNRETPAPQKCISQWDRLASQSVSKSVDDFRAGLDEYDPECAGFENGELQKQATALVHACTFDSYKKVLVTESKCLEAISHYRPRLIDRLTSDDRDYASMSLGVLMNKIFARFSSLQTLSDPERADLAAMTDAAVERKPDHFETHKLRVLIQLMNGVIGKTLGQPETAEALDRALISAMQINPNDPELAEVYLASKILKGDQGESARKYLARHPDSPVAHYYQGMSAWKRGAFDQALVHLKESARLDPESKRFKETYAKALKSKDPKAKIFETRLNVSLEDL